MAAIALATLPASDSADDIAVRAQPGPAVVQRDPSLDLLRGSALLRVVVWHVFAATWMTWFAAMPLMFFVAGTLLAASASRRSHAGMLVRRLRRLLVPLWVYGVVV